MTTPIRVVVVDDSALTRRLIATLLEHDPGVRVVGVAANGREAIARVLELRPDVVTMDVHMPVLDGLATTEQLMAYCPTPILVITAPYTGGELDIGFKMLGAGALEVIEKPAVNQGDFERASRDLVRRIKILARVKVVTHLRGRRRAEDEAPGTEEEKTVRSLPAAALLTRASARGCFPLVVIGASTGGPRVVHQIISALPRDFPAAVLVVQHIARGFSAGMAEWLAASAALPVQVAAEGQQLRPGEVLVAPDGRDLLITAAGQVRLCLAPLLLQRPSVDITMQAAAEVYGPRVTGVLLTGMGRDGARGLHAIRQAGGHTIAQEESSCAIAGMPRAAILLGAASEILPPGQIAARLVTLAGAQPPQSSFQGVPRR